MQDFVVSVPFRSGQVLIKKLNALDQLKSRAVALELFKTFSDILLLDESALWAAAENATLIFLSLMCDDCGSVTPRFSNPCEVVQCLGLDDIAFLATQYNKAFPLCCDEGVV